MKSIIGFVFPGLSVGAVLPAAELHLRYTRPAGHWTEALPVGNGRLGAMVFGAVADEYLRLNGATLWSGAPREWNNPGAKAILPQVRAAIFAGDYVQADELCKEMQGAYNESYQPLGNLRLAFPGAGTATDYARSLDLDRAVATVRCREGGATFTREVFASHADQVIVVRLTCDQPDRISFTASADSLLRHAVETDGKNTLILRGRAPANVDPSDLRSADPIVYDHAFTSGLSAMLLQSHLADGPDGGEEARILDLRPALPSAWPAGRGNGLRARGGFEIADLAWSDGRLGRVTIRSTLGGPVRARCGGETASISTKPGEVITLDARRQPASGGTTSP